ncbi:MAG: hypothetical protein MZV49_09125 [Rhodopseudomonas palustris]|nr:hypothetical protein [Rhodopseudomonas palustris]
MTAASPACSGRSRPQERGDAIGHPGPTHHGAARDDAHVPAALLRCTLGEALEFTRERVPAGPADRRRRDATRRVLHGTVPQHRALSPSAPAGRRRHGRGLARRADARRSVARWPSSSSRPGWTRRRS